MNTSDTLLIQTFRTATSNTFLPTLQNALQIPNKNERSEAIATAYNSCYASLPSSLTDDESSLSYTQQLKLNDMKNRYTSILLSQNSPLLLNTFTLLLRSLLQTTLQKNTSKLDVNLCKSAIESVKGSGLLNDTGFRKVVYDEVCMVLEGFVKRMCSCEIAFYDEISDNEDDDDEEDEATSYPPLLPTLETYLTTKIQPILTIFNPPPNEHKSKKKHINSQPKFTPPILQQSLQILSHHLSANIFNLIADYPNSDKWILELGVAICYLTNESHFNPLDKSLSLLILLPLSSNSSNVNVNMNECSYTYFTTCLKSSIDNRLLKPSATTAQIIDYYISAIRVRSVVDLCCISEPSSSSLSSSSSSSSSSSFYNGKNKDKNTSLRLRKSSNYKDTTFTSIRSYLRTRNDTIRCIVKSLTSVAEASASAESESESKSSGGGLNDELKNSEFKLKPIVGVIDEDDESGGASAGWDNLKFVDNDYDVDFDVAEEMITISDHDYNGNDSEVIVMPKHLPNPPNLSTGTDILSTLVGIYASKSLFITEYRLLLSSKLLSNTTFDTDNEVAILELLKLRFGDGENDGGEGGVREAGIMVKDLDDSKRVWKNVRGKVEDKIRRLNTYSAIEDEDEYEKKQLQLTALIVSHIFWPTLPSKSLNVPPIIKSALQLYATEYNTLKNPRKLVWYDQLGTVEVDVEFIDEDEDFVNSNDVVIDRFNKVRTFTTNPLNATLLYHFGDRETWSATDLANELGVPIDIVRKRMGFWVGNKVVKVVSSDMWCVMGEGEVSEKDKKGVITSSTGDSGGGKDEADEAEALKEAAEAALLLEMEIFKSYILGMLTNLGVLPVERIHNMLKMFCSSGEGKYEKTVGELERFLERMRRLEIIESVDGGWKKV